jgi:hypothetical protein
MQLKIVKPGKKVKNFGDFNVANDATVAQLKVTFEKATKISRHRQGFKFQKKDGTVIVSTDPYSSTVSYQTRSKRILLCM